MLRCSISVLVTIVAGAVGGCGTLAPEEPLPPGLALAGTGAFRKLPVESVDVVADPQADLDEPVLLVRGEAFEIVYTRRAAEGMSLRRARFPSLSDRSPVFDDLGGEGGGFRGRGASQPALLPPGEGTGGGWLLCAVRDGRIECADSPDGDRFAARPDLSLDPDGGDEGAALASPALVPMDTPPRVRLFYVAGKTAAPEDARVFAADAGMAAGGPVGPFVRVDRLPDTTGRDPMVAPGAAPWLSTIGRTTARALRTPVGRVRYDLLVTGRVERSRVCGLFASWDGTRFVPAAAPLLDARLPEEWACAVAAWREGHLMVFVQRSVGRSILAAATSP